MAREMTSLMNHHVSIRTILVFQSLSYHLSSLVSVRTLHLPTICKCREIRSQSMWKVITCWSIKWGLLLLRQQSSHLQILPQRGLKCCFWWERQTKLSVPLLHSLFQFGCTGCNNFTMPKSKTKGSKKHDGGSIKFEHRIYKGNSE